MISASFTYDGGHFSAAAACLRRILSDPSGLFAGGASRACERLRALKLATPRSSEPLGRAARALGWMLRPGAAVTKPRSDEARRRLKAFASSLAMEMPEAPPVAEMQSFSVLTPVYRETVLFCVSDLQEKPQPQPQHWPTRKHSPQPRAQNPQPQPRPSP